MKRIWLSLLLLVAASHHVRAADPCDRKCLEGHVDSVVTAMIAHSPNRLMLSKTVRYTENGVELRIGDGLWRTASARGKYNLYVSDPEAGQVGFYGTLIESGVVLDYIALRLKVFESLISEIEAIVARPGGGRIGEHAGALVEKLGPPRPQFLQTVPPAERMSRDTLIETANSYFSGVVNQTGRFTARFASTCNRIENGRQTTNVKDSKPGERTAGIALLALGCEAQQKTGWWAHMTEIRNRRFPIVDRERGLVMTFAFFDHDAAARTYYLPDGTKFTNPADFPNTIEVSELFQIRDGKIDQIEAVINSVPYGMRSDVWDR